MEQYIVVQVQIVSPHGGGYHDPYIGYDSADVARIEAWYHQMPNLRATFKERCLS